MVKTLIFDGSTAHQPAQVARNTLITSCGRCGRWCLAQHVADALAMAAMQPATWRRWGWAMENDWPPWVFAIKQWVFLDVFVPYINYSNKILNHSWHKNWR